MPEVGSSMKRGRCAPHVIPMRPNCQDGLGMSDRTRKSLCKETAAPREACRRIVSKEVPQGRRDSRGGKARVAVEILWPLPRGVGASLKQGKMMVAVLWCSEARQRGFGDAKPVAGRFGASWDAFRAGRATEFRFAGFARSTSVVR